MPARLLVEVSLRIMGLWFLVRSLVDVVQVLATSSLFASNGGPSLGNYLIAAGTAGVFQLGLGCALVRYAPWTAARIYPPQTDESELQIHVGAGDVYHIACFVMGIYLLVKGAESAAHWAIGAMSTGGPAYRLSTTAGSAIVLIASGLVLTFGARRIGELIASVRYDPDSIPRQRLSLKVLLAVTVAVVVVLGVIRIISMGGP